jgi:hypothetical protein
MKKKYSLILMLALALVSLFHFFILAKIIPYSIAWGGRLTNDEEMYVFESISIVVNVFLVFLLSMKGNFLKFILPQRIVTFLLWCFFVLFILNTIGNFFAKTNFEKFFALVTAGFAFLLWKIQRADKKTSV